MAYLYPKINEQLQGQNQQTSNIFGQEQAAQVQDQDQGPEQKTSTETSVGDTAPGGGGGGGKQSSFQQEQAKPDAKRQSAIRAQQAKQIKVPKALEQAQQSLSQAQKQREESEQRYLDQTRQRDFGLSQDQINQALSGDQASQGQVSQLLGGQAQQAEAYQAPEYDLENINRISTSQGLGDILAEQAGPEYTAGERAYDLALLQRNQPFQNIREQILSGAEQLQGNQADRASDLQAQAQDILQERYGAAQQQARDYLGSQQEGILAALRQRAEEENQALAGLRGGGIGDIALGSEADAISRLSAQNPELAEYLSGAAEDVQEGSFYNVGQDVDYRQLAGAEDARKFNLINMLLGTGTEALMEGQGAGDRYSFNQVGLEDALLNAAMERQKLAQQEQIRLAALAEEEAAAKAAAEAEAARQAAMAPEEKDLLAMQEEANRFISEVDNQGNPIYYDRFGNRTTSSVKAAKQGARPAASSNYMDLGALL